MENRKSKKMAVTDKEIAHINRSKCAMNDSIDALQKYKPYTPDGMEAKSQGITKLIMERDEMQSSLEVLNARLEVETVAFLSGEDTEVEPLFDGEGGGSALKQVS